VVRVNSKAYHPSSGAPIEPGTARRSLRAAAGVVLLGGLSFFAGVSRPVVTEWANAVDAKADKARLIAIALGNTSEFTLAWVLMGIGFILIGIGLGLWGWNVARLETRRLAVVARVLAVVVTIGGVGLGLVRAIIPFVSLERAAVGDQVLDTVGLVGSTSLWIGFIGFGILTWRGPAPRWLSVFLALTGLAFALLPIPAWFMLDALVFGLVGVIHFRRSWPRKAYRPAPTT
jgi:hypothetical protein